MMRTNAASAQASGTQELASAPELPATKVVPPDGRAFGRKCSHLGHRCSSHRQFEAVLYAEIEEHIANNREQRAAANPRAELTLRRQLEQSGFSVNVEKLTALSTLFDFPIYHHCDRINVTHRLEQIEKGESMNRIVGKFEVNAYLEERKSRDRRAARRAQRSHSRSRDHSGGSRSEDADRTSGAKDSAPRRGFTRDFTELAVGASYFKISHVARLAADDFLRNPNLMMAHYLELSAALSALASSGQLSLASSHRVAELAESIALAPAACLDFLDASNSHDVDEYAGFTVSGHLLRNSSILDHDHPEYQHMPLVMIEPLTVLRVAIKHDLQQFIAQPVVHKWMRAEFVGGGMAELEQASKRERMRIVMSWVVMFPLIAFGNLILLLLIAIVPPFEYWYVKKISVHKMQTHERAFWMGSLLPAFKYGAMACGDLVLALGFTFVQFMPFREQAAAADGIVKPIFGFEAMWLSSDSVGFVYICVHSLGCLLEELGHLSVAMFDGVELWDEWKRAGQAVASLVEDIHAEAIVDSIIKTSSHAMLKGGSAMRRSFHYMAHVGTELAHRLEHELHLEPHHAASSAAHVVQGVEHANHQELHDSKPRSLQIAQGIEQATGQASDTLKAKMETLTEAQVKAFTLALEQRKRELRKVLMDVFLRAIVTTLQGIFNFRRFRMYLQNRAVDLTAKLLCVISLFLAKNFGKNQLDEPTLGALSSEAILSYTIALLWLRQIKILQVTSELGSFVYMLKAMTQDLLRWLIIFAFICWAIALSVHVVFRNEHVRTGLDFGDSWETSCNSVMHSVETVQGALLLMIEITLDGASYWHAYQNTTCHASQVPALILLGAFLLFGVVMLINTLIAMMSETFSKVSHCSFANYAFSFAKVLVSLRCESGSVPVPLNLLSLPFYGGRALFGLAVAIRSTGSTIVRLASHKLCPGSHTANRPPVLHMPAQLANGRRPSWPSLHMPAQLAGGRRPSWPSSFLLGLEDAVLNQRLASLAEVADNRDPKVVNWIAEARQALIRDPAKKQQFERSIARFCSLQEDAEEGITADHLHEMLRENNDSVRDIVREILREENGRLEGTAPKNAIGNHGVIVASADDAQNTPSSSYRKSTKASGVNVLDAATDGHEKSAGNVPEAGNGQSCGCASVDTEEPALDGHNAGYTGSPDDPVLIAATERSAKKRLRFPGMRRIEIRGKSTSTGRSANRATQRNGLRAVRAEATISSIFAI